MVVNAILVRSLDTVTNNLPQGLEVGTPVEVENAGGTQEDFIYVPVRQLSVTPANRVVDNVVLDSASPIITAPGTLPFAAVRLSDTASSTTLTPPIAVASVNNGGESVTLASNPGATVGDPGETVTFVSAAGNVTLWIVRLEIFGSEVNTTRIRARLYRATGRLGTAELSAANLTNGNLVDGIATEVAVIEDPTDTDAILTLAGLDRL